MSGPERVWESGWDGHELAQLRRMAGLTLIEKLAWLEEAQRMSLSLAPGQAVVADGRPPVP